MAVDYIFFASSDVMLVMLSS